MKKIICAIIIAGSLYCIYSAYALHPAEKLLQDAQEKKEVASKNVLDEVSAKVDKILENQQVILKEISILKIRIRRG
ncbi:MAG: hypothetical protein KKH94_11710 [Candidatus Omnitrophica bacterium]|nr:hypothetical protein [Candidatus Omnitrophota bacterium]